MIDLRLAGILAVLFVISVCPAFAQEKTGSLEVFIKNESNDKVVPFEVSVKIFKDFENTPFKEISTLEENPFTISSLPLGHRYRVEVYMNNMYADVGYVDLQKSQEKLEMTIKNTGGMRLSVFYKDGETPLEGVRVWIRSHDGKLWDTSQTDQYGHTERAWLYPTTKAGDYYYAEILLDRGIKYTHSPIKLQPNVAQEFKIVTKWPVILDKLFTVEVYNNTKNKVEKQDGTFVAQLYDIKKKKIAESEVTNKGLAYFSKLKINNYALYIKAKDSTGQLGTVAAKKLTVTEETNIIKVYLNNPELNNDYLNCNCIAFRLDDIQDFFLSPAQVAVMSVFQQKEAPLTIGVIGGVTGTDQKLISTIKNSLVEGQLEIANHSWKHNLYTRMAKADQENDIRQTNKKISELFDVTPTTFIPPHNLFNNDTISVLKTNGFTHMSSGENGAIEEPPKFKKSGFYEFPTFAYTAKLNPDTGYWRPLSNAEILEQIDDSLFNYGYAVVMLHPYEFSVYENGGYANKVNTTKVQELDSLLDTIQSESYRTLTIDSIEDFDAPPTPKSDNAKPEMPSCNCIAFRLDNVQDFWLTDVQNTIIDTFDKDGAPLTMTVLGKFIGADPKTVDFIKEKLENKTKIRLANRGWEYLDHTAFDKERQATSIAQTNDKITKVFGVKATTFSPPYDAFNNDTIAAAKQSKILHFSASATNDKLSFTSSMKHVPATSSFVNLVDDDPFLTGTIPQKALTKVQSNLKQYGFAVINFQPSDFAVKTDVSQNEIDTDNLKLLESLIADARSSGINIVLLERIPALLYDDSIMVPDWVKSNAGGWADGKIGNFDFTKGLEYLIEQKIIQIPETTQGAGSEKKIPDWVKSNAGWWADGKIGNSDFVKGIQYLIQNGIIRV